MIFILPFIFGAVGLAVGAVAGAFTSHAAGENDRQAAKHHRKVANELVDKYTNLEKQYYELADESQKQIHDLTRQIALSEIEKDCLRLAVRLQQSLISLTWEIDKEPTIDVLKQFVTAVDLTNNVLCRINEELVNVPSDYYERNFTKAVKINLSSEDLTRKIISEKPKNSTIPKEKKVMKSYSQEFQDTYNQINKTGDKLLNYIKELRAGRLKEGDNTQGLENVENIIKQALQALVKQKYQVAVIAAMNAGKSTFLNALIGADVLATNVEACTVFRTDIRPINAEQTPKLLEHREDQEFPEIIATGDAQEIKRKFSERTYQIRDNKNSDHTISFELEHPIEAISKLPSLAGFTLVDTPGPNEWNSESFNTVALKQTSLQALRTCDAILFILDYLSFKDNINLELLQDLIENRQDFLAQNTGKMYFVLNKVDMKGESDRKIEDVIESLRISLVSFGIPEPNISPVIARQALLSKLIQEGKATDSHIKDFENFYSVKYAERDEKGRRIIPLPEEIASQALEDSGIPKIEETVIKNIVQTSGWNLLSDVLAVLNKAAQSVADTLTTEIRGWELEFEELQQKIEEYKQRSDSAKNKVGNVKQSVESQKKKLFKTFRQEIYKFAETAKNRIDIEIDKVAEEQAKNSGSVSSKENQNLFSFIWNKVTSRVQDDSTSDPYKIKVKDKKDAQEIGKIINDYCAPIVHNFWLDTQDRLVREGAKIQEELVKQIQQEIQAISDELSQYIGETLQIEIGTNAIQFPKFEFSGIDTKIQEQQKVFERNKKITMQEERCCASPHVYEQDVVMKTEVSYYEVDLRLTAQGIKDKIDEQVKRNIGLLKGIIDEQVEENFQKGEQQINDYINRFQINFDNLLIQRVKRESESHEIVSTLKSQKSEVSQYLNELIFIQEVLDNWKPSPINR
ncbi:dynamin family protein [Anabaena sp. UHCC 0253]|uniref:dynamin family protein n=1 Tax=Anabaena sp. UHCC 0253 TaxID=2590019 RepID=UPI0014470E6D|nr:dynamin family protein [Anabaena sp. UHCC 0253]MTJ52366.1 dynamin family protein [Anabaena sp. UHCC 0253]